MPNQANSSNSSVERDEAIVRLLRAVIDRPLFLGLLHNTLYDPTNILHYSMSFGTIAPNREVVGSSRDGLKCFKVFNSNDIDCLVYSDTVLDETAERLFEYRDDFPVYFHFPQPDTFPDLPKVDGKYVNPNHIRQMDKKLFKEQAAADGKLYGYSILPEQVLTSDTKCAITRIMNNKDSTYSPEFAPAAGSLDHKFHMAWEIDQRVLAYHLNAKNHERLQFLRELLYGPDKIIETFDTLTTSMKHLVSYMRFDTNMTIFSVFDMLYFDTEHFQNLLKKSVDVADVGKFRCDSRQLPHGEYNADLVPAIRCKAWPRVAQNFLTRERKWPPKEVVDDIVHSGFQVVARGCVLKPEPTKDFILSFSPSEAKLIDHLPHGAKTAYCLLKSCYKCALRKPDIGDRKTLKTYHLKTALLWIAEKTEPARWDDLDPLAAVRMVIDFLIESLHKKYLPVFFVPDSNLIGDFNTEDQRCSVDVLSDIRKNPATFIQLLIDMEWDYTRITMVDDGSFEKLKRDGGPFYSLDWETQIKMFMYGISGHSVGYGPIDELMNDPYCMPRVVEKCTKDALNSNPPLNIADGFRISDQQLEGMDIFVQAISQNDMDLYSVLDMDVDPEIFKFEENKFKEEVLEKYCMYNREDDNKFGEIFIYASRMRLKFYASVFHDICNKLYLSCLMGNETYTNKDAVYIIRFLRQLINKKEFDADNLIDCLHYLLFFCHFTRQRHFALGMTDQILRSMREFFQDARNLMTVYFNPRLILPQPYQLDDSTVGVLRECYPGKGVPFAAMGKDKAKSEERVMDDLPLD